LTASTGFTAFSQGVNGFFHPVNPVDPVKNLLFKNHTSLTGCGRAVIDHRPDPGLAPLPQG
jgi:hypothetical protein